MHYRNTLAVIVVCLGITFTFNLPALAQEQLGGTKLLLKIGKECYEQGDYEKALVEFNRIILIDPENKRALLYIQIINEKMALEEERFSREEAVELALEEAEEPAAGEAVKTVSTGGAWGVPEGHYLVELYSRYYWHDSHFDNNRNEVNWAFGGGYEEVTTELKIEYGLFERFTLIGYFPYKYACWEDNFAKQTTSGMADIWVGGKYRFFEEPVVTALQLRAKFPAGYDENAVPALGAGQIDVEARILGQKSFDDLDCYLKGELGYRARMEDLNDEIPYFFGFGYSPIDKLTLKVEFDGMEGLDGTGRSDDEDYTKGVVGLVYNLIQGSGPMDSLDLEVGYGKTFAGKNTSAASEVIFKINCGFSSFPL